MSKYRNQKKEKFIADISAQHSLSEDGNDLTIRCKFNLSYFDSSQRAGQNFKDWTHKQLYELLEKLKDYTTKSLDYWRQQRVGKGGLKIFTLYDCFPRNSDFSCPKNIPHQARWGRFRLGSKVRIVGFTIPPELHNTAHQKTGEFFDKNTFYLVFLDRDHRFYIPEEK